MVDDLASMDPWRPRSVLVQGRAQGHRGDRYRIRGRGALIRITPDKITS